MEMSAPGSVGDYAACIGTTGSDSPVTLKTPNGTLVLQPTGVFVRPSGIRAAEITDGLTHTLLVGEKHIPHGGKLSYPWDCNLYDGHNAICTTRSAGPGFPLATSP